MKSFKLFENPNYVQNFQTKDGNYVDFHFNEGFAFGFYNGDFCVNYTHIDCLYDWLKEKGWYNLPIPDINNKESLKEFHDQYPDVPIEKIVEYEKHAGRGDLAGRYFPKYKLITFWKFPKDNKELHDVVNAIETYLNKDIWNDDECKVEVLVDEELEMRDDYWWRRDAKVEFIPLKEYKGGPKKHWQDEVNPHLLN
ncbi:MAG: hypothetical protein HPY57_15545 [Ignavibacteria bacterium]|nr:hypothetical protein [Ignavibacteria bacterium]